MVNVIVRLDALEETVKEIVDSKKPSETVDKDPDPKIKSNLVEPTPAARRDMISSSSPPIGVKEEDKNPENKTREQDSSPAESKKSIK